MVPKFHNSPYTSITKDENKSSRSEEREPIYNDRQRILTEQESLFFKQLALTSPDILFILETDQPIKRIINTKLVKKNSGSPLHQLFSQNNFLESVFLEDLHELLENLKDFFKQDELTDFGEVEIRLLDPYKKVNFFNIRFTPYPSKEEDKAKKWFCLARDKTAEKENLKAMEDSQSRLQLALDGSNMGTWSFDPLNQKIDCDSRTCKILGFTNRELKEDVNHVFSRIHPEDRILAIQTALSALKRKGRFNHDFRILLPGESIIRHIAVIGELISDDKNQLTKLTGVCLDISHNKMAENKIKTSETFLDESQRIAKIGCFDWDLTLDKVNCTRQLYEILEISPTIPFSLEKFYSNVHEQDLQSVKSAVDDSIKKGIAFNKEFHFRCPDGSYKVLWAHGQTFRKGSQTQRMIGTIQDISEKREKEMEFNTQSLIIRSILHNLPVIIEIVEKDGRVHSLLGPAGLGRIGMSENETVGKNIFQQNPSAALHIKKALKGETVNFTQEKEYKGRKLFFLSFFFYDAERELAIGFSIDVTAQKQVEAAFQQISAKNQELERMNKVMDLFVYAVAHDLKNPVNNLDMLAQLMDDTLDPKEQGEYLDALQKSVKRLKKTIAGLTEIVGIESIRNDVNKVVSFSDVLQHVLADLQPLLLKKNGKLEVSFQEPKINYNQTYLTSILKNLISNSIKYAYPDRAALIEVETRKSGGFIILTVKDNGIGIDLEQYEKSLFKPFKRFTKLAEGTGVGLHLIKTMVEKNGGHVEIESTINKGTIFRCFLKPSKA